MQVSSTDGTDGMDFGFGSLDFPLLLPPIFGGEWLEPPGDPLRDAPLHVYAVFQMLSALDDALLMEERDELAGFVRDHDSERREGRVKRSLDLRQQVGEARAGERGARRALLQILAQPDARLDPRPPRPL